MEEGFEGAESEARAASALERFAASSASRRWARPQVQSLHARRRLPVRGRHSGAMRKGGVISLPPLVGERGKLTLDDGTGHIFV